MKLIDKLVARFPDFESYLNKQSPLRRKIAGGFAWSLLANVLILGLGIVLNVLLTRMLPPEQVGLFFLALSIISLISTISLLGLKGSMVKLLSDALVFNQFGNIIQIVLKILLLGLGGVLLGGAFLSLSGGRWLVFQIFDAPVLAALLGILALWLCFSTLQTLVAEAFRGLQDIRWAALFGEQGAMTRIIFVTALAGIWFCYRYSTLKIVVVVAVIANAVTLVLSAGILGQKLYKDYWGKGAGENNIDFGTILSTTWPFWINSITMLSFTQIDVWFLGAFRLESEVALYGVAVRLAVLVSTPLFILNAVLSPFVAELYTKGEKQKLERLLRHLSTLVSIPALGVFFVFLFWGKSLLNLLYGPFYQQAYIPLLVLTVGQVVNVLSGSCGILMNMSGHQKQLMKLSLLTGGTSLLFHYLLVPQWGIIATSLVVMVNVILFNLLAMHFSWKKIGIKTWLKLPI